MVGPNLFFYSFFLLVVVVHPKENDPYTWTFVIERKMLMPDGLPKNMITINGASPGPLIRAPLGAELTITVHNKLKEPTTVHWHGLTLMNNTYGNYYDGVASVTQCGIPSGSSFTYHITATDSGTHWYHSHFKGQREDGLYGPLIIDEEKPTHQDMVAAAGLPCISGEDVLLVTDLWPVPYQERENVYLKDVHNSFCFHSMLCNGKWVYDCDDHHRDPVKKLTCNSTLFGNTCPAQQYKNNYYRVNVAHNGTCGGQLLRIVGSSSSLTWVLMVDGHQMTVIASDGHWLQPFTVDSLIVSPGETYDVLVPLKTDKSKNYWIRAANWKVARELAVFAYNQTDMARPVSVAPTDWELAWTNDQFTKMRRSSVEGRCVSCQEVNRTERITMTLDPDDIWWRMDDEIFQTPNNTKVAAFGGSPSPLIEYQVGTKIRWIIENLSPYWHPMHLHGHFMNLLGVSPSNVLLPPKKAKTNSPPTRTLPLPGSQRKHYSVNQTDFKINITLNTEDPPVKHTINVPTYGYAVVEVDLTNPGAWLIHCHVDLHLMNGLGLVVANKPFGKPPPNYPLPTSNCYAPPNNIMRWILGGVGAAGFVLTFGSAAYCLVWGKKVDTNQQVEEELLKEEKL